MFHYSNYTLYNISLINTNFLWRAAVVVFYKKCFWSAVFEHKPDLCLVIVRPAVLKALSDGTLVAWIDKYCLSNMQSLEKACLCQGHIL